MPPSAALRGVALGRKAGLFCGSDRGGQRAAVLYSLIVTAELNANTIVLSRILTDLVGDREGLRADIELLRALLRTP